MKPGEHQHTRVELAVADAVAKISLAYFFGEIDRDEMDRRLTLVRIKAESVHNAIADRVSA